MLQKLLIASLCALSLTACAAEPGSAPRVGAALPSADKAPATAPAGKGAIARTAGVAGAKATAAQAAASTNPNDVAIRAALTKAVPGVEIDRIVPAALPGFQEVSMGTQVVYVSNDGHYLMQGTLVRLADRHNFTSASENALRRTLLDSAGSDKRIVFAAAHPRYKVTVFTDIDCTFCQKLHSQIAAYNKEGITVEYLFFPRSGPSGESFDKAVSVWCASDRQRALTEAKANPKNVPRRTCANPVAADYALGAKMGFNGTPAVYAADGAQIGGYLSPEEMLTELERRAGVAKPAAVASND
jgi:thiol:disulfide interchange protein DsbC